MYDKSTPDAAAYACGLASSLHGINPLDTWVTLNTEKLSSSSFLFFLYPLF